MKRYASKVLQIAEAEIGYLEKATNSQLDDKLANAGKGNYTKYARDLDAIPGFYNGKKNGYAWCDVFVDWLFVQAFGVDVAKELLCQPDKSYGAGCTYSARYYKQNGQFYTSNPKPGDQIFFGNVSHTGIVYKVDNTYVYTIEGNTSGASGVVANGGGVCKKKYKLNYNKIHGYGRPKYDDEPSVEQIHNTRIDTVRKVQEWLNKDYDAGLVADNQYGPKTKAALVKALQKELGFTDSNIDGKYGPMTNSAVRKNNLSIGSKGNLVKVLQGLLVCNGYFRAYVDGSYGTSTESSVRKLQTKNNLTADGIAGCDTFTVLCK